MNIYLNAKMRRLIIDCTFALHFFFLETHLWSTTTVFRKNFLRTTNFTKMTFLFLFFACSKKEYKNQCRETHTLLLIKYREGKIHYSY